jgi:hypothetical protein
VFSTLVARCHSLYQQRMLTRAGTGWFRLGTKLHVLGPIRYMRLCLPVLLYKAAQAQAHACV